MTAVAFTARHRSLAGPLDSPIADLAHDTHVRATATIQGATFHGAGDSRRATLLIADDAGATVVATIDADHLWRVPDFALTRGARIQFGGLVRRFPGTGAHVSIAIYGINPA